MWAFPGCKEFLLVLQTFQQEYVRRKTAAPPKHTTWGDWGQLEWKIKWLFCVKTANACLCKCKALNMQCFWTLPVMAFYINQCYNSYHSGSVNNTCRCLNSGHPQSRDKAGQKQCPYQHRSACSTHPSWLEEAPLPPHTVLNVYQLLQVFLRERNNI